MSQGTTRPYAVYDQSISVPYTYPVYFGRDLFAGHNDLLEETMGRLGEVRRHRAAVYIDSGVIDTDPGLISRITDYFQGRNGEIELVAPPVVLEGGEAAKNGWDNVHDIVRAICDLDLDRQSYIIAVGGGSVLDMVGFATAIAHRGLRLIRMPTTTLAQNDAGVGVKNSLNENGQKNFIGTFAPPFAVLNDSNFLTTLSFTDWIGGISEAFKIALIKDAVFFRFLDEAAEKLKDRDLEAMERAVHRCAVLHLEHIRTGGDPFEFGSARPLDFGHWAAHKIESMSGYTIAHGQAVAVGIAVDLFYAMEHGYVTEDEFMRTLRAFVRCGLPIWHESLGRTNGNGNLEVLDGLEQFRQHLGGRLTFTVPRGIGEKVELHHMQTDTVGKAVSYLENLHRELN